MSTLHTEPCTRSKGDTSPVTGQTCPPAAKHCRRVELLGTDGLHAAEQDALAQHVHQFVVEEGVSPQPREGRARRDQDPPGTGRQESRDGHPDRHLAASRPTGLRRDRRTPQRRPRRLPAARTAGWPPRPRRLVQDQRGRHPAQPEVHRLPGLQPSRLPFPARAGQRSAVVGVVGAAGPRAADPEVDVRRPRRHQSGADGLPRRPRCEPASGGAAHLPVARHGVLRLWAAHVRRPSSWQDVYYLCWPKANNRGRPDKHTGHPATVYLGEHHLLAAIGDFYAQRVFGPDRRAMLSADLATVDDRQARARDAERDRHQRALANSTAASRTCSAKRKTPDPTTRSAPRYAPATTSSTSSGTKSSTRWPTSTSRNTTSRDPPSPATPGYSMRCPTSLSTSPPRPSRCNGGCSRPPGSPSTPTPTSRRPPSPSPCPPTTSPTSPRQPTRSRPTVTSQRYRAPPVQRTGL